MARRLFSLVFALAAALAFAPARADVSAFTNQEAAAGLKAALEKGAVAAVDLLGRTDGFYGNSAVKIPLPDSLKRYEKMARNLGMGKYADELELTMNRAAEAAVPEAKKLFVESAKKMTVQDAKGILTGGQTSGTEYFQRSTADQLRVKFLPIVKQATAKVKLAEKYNQYAQKGVQLGLVKKEQANLDDYVTQKALDGLFLMVGEEEKKIRANPVAAGSDIIKKVFGALK
jgi:predicted peroxiredoxin